MVCGNFCWALFCSFHTLLKHLIKYFEHKGPLYMCSSLSLTNKVLYGNLYPSSQQKSDREGCVLLPTAYRSKDEPVSNIILLTPKNGRRKSGRPVSHAIMSSMQYYPEDSIAYAITSAGRFCIMQSCPPGRCCIIQLCPPGHICICSCVHPRAKPSLQ